MFPEAYEQYGLKLEEGTIMVLEGIATNRDGEIRTNANSIFPIDQALVKWVEEITWLIEPNHDESLLFAKELFSEGEKTGTGALIRLGIAGRNDGTGLVAEADERGSEMKMSVEKFKEWRAKSPVSGARVKIIEPELPLNENMAGRSDFTFSFRLDQDFAFVIVYSFMMTIEIQLRKGEPMDRAIRRLKKRLDREGVIRDVRAKRYFEKPSDKKGKPEKLQHSLKCFARVTKKCNSYPHYGAF